jgi:TetR/AcrR family transcriptional regulator
MEPPADNRSLILSEAARLFAERGYEAVSVGEICDSATITKPTLYHYFGSKRGLLDALIEEGGAALLASVREAARTERDVRLGLERIAFAFARCAKADPTFARLRLSMSFAPPGSEPGIAAAAYNKELFAVVEAFFRRAAEDHGNMKGRSRAFAGTFIGTMDTYTGFWLSGASGLEDQVLREALRQFMYGIFS